MTKIDLEKLICYLAERNSIFRDALNEQGLEYKDGEIVEVQKMKEAGYEWDAEKKELKKIEEGKASFANRQVYNRAILKLLSNYVEKYPDIRFGQMLYNLGVNPHFDEESRETYCNLNETINKQKS